MLCEFITTNRERLVAMTRTKVAKRFAPAEIERAQAGGAPLFLDQLVETLRHPLLTGTIERGATAHGAALLGLGYTVSQVVHDYGDICQAITELAGDTDLNLTIEEFRILNLCVDNAIAEAVTEYSRVRDITSDEDDEMERNGVDPAPVDTTDLRPELPFTD
jgi:hypothetical protein